MASRGNAGEGRVRTRNAEFLQMSTDSCSLFFTQVNGRNFVVHE